MDTDMSVKLPLRILGLAVLLIAALAGMGAYKEWKLDAGVVSSTPVVAEMIDRHRDVVLTGSVMVTKFTVDLAYEGLTYSVNDKQLYDAFDKGTEVSAYVRVYKDGSKRLTLEEYPK